jgi:hypothetical protein
VRLFTEGARFWDSHELQVTGAAEGEAAAIIPPATGRHFDFLLEEVRDDGTVQMFIRYAKGLCPLRRPPLAGTLLLTAETA